MVRWVEIDRQGLAQLHGVFLGIIIQSVMLARHPEGTLWGYCARMTSHPNEGEYDRWSRHYCCSQNLTYIALFGTTHPHILKRDWETVMSSLLPVPSRPPTGVLFICDKLFTECVYLLFKPSLSQVHKERWQSGDDRKEQGLSVIMGTPSLIEGQGTCYDCKVFAL